MKSLRIKYNKRENDFIIDWQGTYKSDAWLIYNTFLKDDILKEFENRGYDLKTLKIEIKGKNETK